MLSPGPPFAVRDRGWLYRADSVPDRGWRTLNKGAEHSLFLGAAYAPAVEQVKKKGGVIAR